MTTNTQQAAGPIIATAHIALVLGCGEPTVRNLIRAGKLPQPTQRGYGGRKEWKLSTLRAWNPAVADAIESLLKHPALNSVKAA